MEVGELLSLGGEAAFRDLEYQALRQTIDKYPSCIVETGGSLVSESNTYRLLQKSFFTVWIKARPEDHLQRVINQGDTRPIAGHRKAIHTLRMILRERAREYDRADYQLLTSGRQIDDCVNELVAISSAYFAAIG